MVRMRMRGCRARNASRFSVWRWTARRRRIWAIPFIPATRRLVSSPAPWCPRSRTSPWPSRGSMCPWRCTVPGWKFAARTSRAPRPRILCLSTMSRRRNGRRLADMQTKLLIDGILVAGVGQPERILDPASGRCIAEVAEAGPAQLSAAVAAADRAAPGWAQTAPKDRATLLLKIADRIEADAEAFAKLESDNTGKPFAAALNDEIPAIADVFRFFAGAARVQHGALAGEYLPGYTSMIRRDPVGVVASIAPWNYPLMMAAWKLAPALAAGNTVVLKPSEQTPLTALKLGQLLAEVLPKGVVNVVCGRGERVGQRLIAHPRVAMISLTGDVGTGRKVLAAAQATLKRTHLELGGKAPVIVFDDADIEAVVSGLRSFGFYNAGQDCTAACRVYAGARVYEKLVADLSSAASTLMFDEKLDAENEIGPLISARQQE